MQGGEGSGCFGRFHRGRLGGAERLQRGFQRLQALLRRFQTILQLGERRMLALHRDLQGAQFLRQRLMLVAGGVERGFHCLQPFRHPGVRCWRRRDGRRLQRRGGGGSQKGGRLRRGAGHNDFDGTEPLLINRQTVAPGLIEFAQRVVLGGQVVLNDIENLPGGVGVGGDFADQGVQMFQTFLMFLHLVTQVGHLGHGAPLGVQFTLKVGDVLAGGFIDAGAGLQSVQGLFQDAVTLIELLQGAVQTVQLLLLGFSTAAEMRELLLMGVNSALQRSQRFQRRQPFGEDRLQFFTPVRALRHKIVSDHGQALLELLLLLLKTGHLGFDGAELLFQQSVIRLQLD